MIPCLWRGIVFTYDGAFLNLFVYSLPLLPEIAHMLSHRLPEYLLKSRQTGHICRCEGVSEGRFAEVIPRIRESSFAYTLEMSTSSLRLNTCRNCPSINRYICEAYDSLRAIIFSSFISPEILCPKTYPLIICAKHDTILLRVALAFITCVSFPVWSLGNYYTQRKPRQYVFASPFR